MSWLVGMTLASMAAAFIVMRILDYIFAGMGGWISVVAKPAVHVGVWAAVTAHSGMRAFSERVRGLRHRCRSVQKQLAGEVEMGNP